MPLKKSQRDELTDRLKQTESYRKSLRYLLPHEIAEITWRSGERDLVYVWGITDRGIYFSDQIDGCFLRGMKNARLGAIESYKRLETKTSN